MQPFSTPTNLYVPNKARKYILTDVKVANYTPAIDELVRLDPSGGAFTITLPTAVGVGALGITLKNVTNSVVAVTINTTSGQTYDGAASGSMTMTTAFQIQTFISDGANWMKAPP